MSTRLVFFPFAQSLIDYVKLFLHHKKCLKFGNIKIIIFFWLDEPRSAWNYPEIFMWRNSQNCKSWEFWKNLFFVNFCKYKKTSTSLTMGTFCAVFPKTFYFEKKNSVPLWLTRKFSPTQFFLTFPIYLFWIAIYGLYIFI